MGSLIFPKPWENLVVYKRPFASENLFHYVNFFFSSPPKLPAGSLACYWTYAILNYLQVCWNNIKSWLWILNSQRAEPPQFTSEWSLLETVVRDLILGSQMIRKPEKKKKSDFSAPDSHNCCRGIHSILPWKKQSRNEIKVVLLKLHD